ncbi:MAG: Bax inhibitor-1/YccA family protein [Geminicoccaceae bacterium]
MADPRVVQGQVVVDRDVDEGLRSYMLSVYNYMGLGLALTGLVALVVSQVPALYEPILFSPLRWVVMLAPIGFVLFLSFRIQSMSFGTAQMTFWAYAALNGLSLSIIFLVYPIADISRILFITAAVFGSMSLYGYTTKRDLSGWGSFLFMGLIGVIIASIVNIFLQSSMLHFVFSVVGMLVFVGLTAYDTQSIKEMYHELDGSDVMGRKAIMGALRLYLDFINMFLIMLQFFGGNSE